MSFFSETLKSLFKSKRLVMAGLLLCVVASNQLAVESSSPLQTVPNRPQQAQSLVAATTEATRHTPQATPQATSKHTLYTREPLLQNALVVLQQAPTGQASWERLQTHKTKILFKALKEFGPVYHQFDALGWMSPAGQRFIYIHEKHRNESPYALAALIAHEALHDDAWNSKAEEIAGWSQEAAVWQFFVNSGLASSKPTASPLEKRLNTLMQWAKTKQLARQVYNNTAYRALPEQSPGF